MHAATTPITDAQSEDPHRSSLIPPETPEPPLNYLREKVIRHCIESERGKGTKRMHHK